MKKSKASPICLIFIVLFASRGLSQTSAWQETNGPYGGNIHSLLFYSGNLLLAGTHTGIYKSSDEALTWERIQLDGNVNALARDSQGNIYAATDAFPFGIHRSTDGGMTWTQVYSDYYMRTLSLVVAGNGYIFAGTDGFGILRSTDNGSHWMLLTHGFYSGGEGRAVLVNHGGDIFAGLYFGGVVRSTDNGDSWSDVTPMIGWILALGLDSSGYLYAGSELNGCYRSSNGGTTWILPDSQWIGTDFTSFASDSIGNVYAGTSRGVLLSTDHGQTWNQINSGIDSSRVQTLAIGPSYVQAGTDGRGVFRSSNRGAQWGWSSSGLRDLDVRSLAFDSAGHVLAGTWYNGLYHSTDGGLSWAPINSLPPNGFVSSLSVGPTGMLYAVQSNILFQSSDDGKTWNRDTFNIRFIGVYSVIASYDSWMYAGTSRGVFRSSDEGQQWLPPDSGDYGCMNAITIRNEDGVVFAGSECQNWDIISRSTDHGAHWTPLPLSSTSVFFRSIALKDHSTVLVGTTNGIYISEDDGQHWHSSVLHNQQVNSIIVTRAGTILAGTFNGVFQSTTGTEWDSMDSGLEWKRVWSFSVDGNGELLAGTSIGGVYRLVLPTGIHESTGNSNPLTFSLSQNYPNPFNPATSIEFSIPRSNYVSLKTYNILGDEIRTLVSNELDAGTHTIIWDASGLPSGVYFYRLQSGSFSGTKKILVIR